MTALKLIDQQGHAETPPPSSTALTSRDGAKALLTRDADGHEQLSICDRHGAILFEYDAERGRGLLRMPSGDLRLEAPQGHIQMLAGKGVQCVAVGEIALQSATAIRLTTMGESGTPSGVRVTKDSVAVASDELTVRSGRATVRVSDTTVVGRTLSTTLERAEQWLGKLETTAGSILERSDSVFRIVKKLHELRAGRMRTLVQGTVHTRGERISVMADKTVHIDGEKINLG